MKGVLHSQGSERLFVLQAVYEVFDIQESAHCRGDDGDRTGGRSIVVASGRGLDSELLREQLQSAISAISSSPSPSPDSDDSNYC